MAPCRPTNLNKRAYPGNASVIGPTRQTTCCPTSTTCNSFVSTLCGSSTINWTLGCVNQPTSCPCCQCCCCCTCTVCTRTIPSGMWKSSEQLEAKKRDAWGVTTSSNTAPTGYTTNNGTINSSVNCYGYLFCNATNGQRWFAAAGGVGLRRCWYCRNDALTLANATGGSGWFLPAGIDSGIYLCRVYWTAGPVDWIWSDQQHNFSNAPAFRMSSGQFCRLFKPSDNYVRAFRCI